MTPEEIYELERRIPRPPWAQRVFEWVRANRTYVGCPYVPKDIEHEEGALLATSDRLQTGDLLLACVRYRDRSGMKPRPFDWTITSWLDCSHRVGVANLDPSRRLYTVEDFIKKWPPESFYFMVHRVGQPARSPVQTRGKAIDPFPHTCPRCSAKAYVGLFEVAHAPGAGAGCPARQA